MTHSVKHPTIRNLKKGESEDESINFYNSLNSGSVLVA
jgi:hypothetical protein